MDGLTFQEAQRRLQEEGPNILPRKGRIIWWKLLFHQFSSFIIWLLIAAALIAALLGETIDAFAILAIVILNAILGFFQEYRAESSIEALSKLSSPTAKVIRDGNLKVIPAKELVVGDLVLIEAGDHIPADGKIIDLAHLAIDESSLTGESTPVSKKVEEKAFMSTNVVSGKGHILITETGIKTEIGKIAQSLMEQKREATPLEKKLDHLGKKLVYICLGIVVVVFALGLFRGTNLIEMLLIALSLAVAAIPEGLPAAVTITLSIGVRKMAEQKALIRRLSSVETLGSTSIICSDKTGTLTENAMTVREIFVDNQFVKVTGSGYTPEGEFDAKPPTLEFALKIGVLCNNANLYTEDDHWVCAGDPTEGALLAAAQKLGLNKNELENSHPLIEENPFDSERKMMSMMRQTPQEKLLFVKGAPDILIERSHAILVNGKEVPLDKEKLLSANSNLTSRAYRVLGVAYQKDFSKPPEENLIFVGLIAMIDPPRPKVKEAIALCKKAGIKTLMVTGDYKNTAQAIATELDMDQGKVISGKELDQLTDDEIEQITVFSRISAHHKLRIVRALQTKGHVTAMTGDGVNDAPAVHTADIGIAMGITGTDVTKESSDMIILDDNFATIVEAVKQGRGIYDNIVKFVSYLLSSNIAEILVIFILMLVGPGGTFVPLLPVQILWMNLVTDGFPAITLALDPIDPSVMDRPPRPRHQEILNRRFILLIFSISLIVTAGALIACFYGLRTSTALAQTMTFTTLIVLELVRAQMIRRQYQLSLFSNRWLLLALLGSFLLQLAVIYIPPLQLIFGTVPLDAISWAVLFGIGFVVWWVGLFVTKIFNK